MMTEPSANHLSTAERLLHGYFQEVRPRTWPELPLLGVAADQPRRWSGRHFALVASVVVCFFGLLWFGLQADGEGIAGLPEGAGPATARRPKLERPAPPAEPSRATPLR